MKINEIEISKLKELKEKSKMLKDERQKGKIPSAKTYEYYQTEKVN